MKREVAGNSGEAFFNVEILSGERKKQKRFVKMLLLLDKFVLI